MKNIITYGTFDTLHYGHILLIQRAKALGDHLIVALSTDEFNLQKGKSSFHSFNQRKSILSSLKEIDIIIEERSWGQKVADIKTYNIDTFVMGSDWVGHFDDLSKYCNVVYLDRTEKISSTMLKEAMI